jgi:uncharacterized protein (UPF0332 family)
MVAFELATGIGIFDFYLRVGVRSLTPFDWSEYFKLAVELSERPDDASLRSAISRAYYYVYHLGLKRAEHNDFKAVSGEGTHLQLWRLFSASPEPECQRLAAIASRLKEKREKADYNSFFARVQEEVPAILSDARDFANRLQRLDVRHPNPKSRRFGQ